MTDTQGLTTDTAPIGAAAVSTGASSAPDPAGAVSAPAPAGTTDVLAEPPVDQAVFPRSYVESIRQEAARYRNEARTYQVFEQYEPQDRDVWINLADTWARNPAQAAQIMQQIATGVLGEQEPVTDNSPPRYEAGAPNGDVSGDDGLTDDERMQKLIDSTLAQRDQAAAEQQAIDQVMRDVRDAGFDPNSAEGFMVLWNANNQTNGDIAQAAEMVRGYRQSIIDDYVQGRSSGRVAMPTPGQGVQATSAGEPITNFEDARKAADNFLRERRGA